MRKITYIYLAFLMVAISCNKYDDSLLNQRMDSVESRIETIRDTLNKLNDEASVLKSIVDAYTKGTTVSGIQAEYDGQNLTGYKITLSDGSSFVIHNGKDGKDGYIGKDGRDGHTPLIGVVYIGNIYYWTVDGSLLKDSTGNPIPASPDPSESQAKDGYTPVISIVDGKWVATVNGSQYILGDFTSTDSLIVDDVFSTVSQTETSVSFTLADGNVITLPKTSLFSINLSVQGNRVISYSVEGAVAEATVDVVCESGWSASVQHISAKEGTITIASDSESCDASFIVLCSDGSHNAMSSFRIISGNIEIL